MVFSFSLSLKYVPPISSLKHLFLGNERIHPPTKAQRAYSRFSTWPVAKVAVFVSAFH